MLMLKKPAPATALGICEIQVFQINPNNAPVQDFRCSTLSLGTCGSNFSSYFAGSLLKQNAGAPVPVV